MSPVYLAHCRTLLSILLWSDTYIKETEREESSQALCLVLNIFLFSYQGCLGYFKILTAHTTSFSVIQLLPRQLWAPPACATCNNIFPSSDFLWHQKGLSMTISSLHGPSRNPQWLARKRKMKDLQSQAVKTQADKRSCLKPHLLSTSTLLCHQKHRQVLYRPSEITYPGITSCHEDCLVPCVLKNYS